MAGPGSTRHGPPCSTKTKGLEHPDEDVLREVLGSRTVAGHAGEKVEQRHVVPLEQHAELAQVAVPNRPHKGFVSHACQWG
jgi:hypothetical protein